MYYVYVLKSEKDYKFYIGSTSDLKRRFAEHQSGKVNSTKNRIPFKIMLYEAYANKEIAQKREKYLKSSDGHKDIDKRI
ncbi:excinuclease ABC subunit C [bacterium (Candidatus Howlettbacteria) CG_4_10_14_0_8_um_filter_40_9]|nr:MAG: excinuclease ABC subunit C [bacterium (Candidatus Howlettbacteria) CG_4_10_14_0_8_um_filter_40_9]